MKILLLTGTPKSEGLSCACVNAAEHGALTGGAEVEIVRLHDLKIPSCRVCGEGWGTCRAAQRCAFGNDGFDAVQEKVRGCDALIIQTPVYWGEMTEELKAFTDRLRRCEAMSSESALNEKKVLLIAAPGGSGNGGVSCFGQMERFVQHMRGRVFDFIIVNRWNNSYKLKAIEAAAEALARGV